MSTANKLGYVDALRGVAILGVILVHCAQYGTNDYPGVIATVFGKGQMGVQLFYVMSALTLFLSYERRLNKELHPDRNFFIRRFFRIAPMYYLGILYYLWQNGRGPNFWTGFGPGITDANIAANFTFLHGFNPYWFNSLVPGGWSIAVEMCFYLLIPFLFRWVKDGRAAFRAFVVLVLVRLVLHALLLKLRPIDNDWLWREFLYYYLPSQLPVFMLGILLHFVLRGRPEDTAPRPLDLFLFAGLLLLHLATGREVILPPHVMFGLGFVLLAWTLAHHPFKLVVNPVVRHIGMVSFSLYLVHFAVLHWMEHFHVVDLVPASGTIGALVNYGVRYLLVVVLGTAISTALYHAVEVPMQRVGQRLIDRWEKRPPAAP
ncbi:MAG: acyltransferase [Flavobacteriales bacterium]|nr:acyltransferase [Flavobacteriales bacterium]